MKKMKKIMAVLLSLAMMLGMGMTTLAAPKTEATITVENAEEATLTYYQVIQAAPEATTGWDFVDDTAAAAFVTAFNVADGQAAIQAMIDSEYSAAEMQTALKAVHTSLGESYAAMLNPQTVNAAGLYAIIGSEEDYNFSFMAAFVGFGEVKNADGQVVNEYPSLVDTTINAKKQPAWVEKAATDQDAAVAIDDVVTYELNSTVPFLTGEDDRYYRVIDEIRGAEYLLNANGKLEVTVKVGTGNDAVTEKYAVDVTAGAEGDTFDQTFELNLDTLVVDNSNANKTIEITYQAVVKGTQVGNDVFFGDGTNDGKNKYGSAHDDLYTGKITLLKYDAESGDAKTPLAGAGFEVRVKGQTDALKFVSDVVIDGAPIAGSYTYAPNATTEAITTLYTDAKGEIIVNGLDVGTYTFTEVEAPEGFSINATPAEAELVINPEDTDAVAEAIFEAETDMGDTRLSALPATGGIGTTIFTIGGCLIMIIAAALFFASRRKNSK